MLPLVQAMAACILLLLLVQFSAKCLPLLTLFQPGEAAFLSSRFPHVATCLVLHPLVQLMST